MNLIKVISIAYLSLIFLPFSREPIQADDLTGYATVIQLNGDFGVLDGYARWISLQFQMSSHFVPTGWSFQWIQYSTVDLISHYTRGNFPIIWGMINLIIIVSLSYFSIRNIVFGLSKLADTTDPKLLQFKCAFIIVIFGANLTIHSPWSIDPFASHLAFGLLTTFLFSLIFRLTLEIILSKEKTLTTSLNLKYLATATLGLTCYDLFISLLFVSTILILMYSKYILVTATKKIPNFALLFIVGVIYPVGFFLLTRLVNQVPEYEGTKLQVNPQNIEATFVGIFSTYQPVGTLKAVRVYNLPITLHLSAIIISFILITFFFLLRDLALQHDFKKSNKSLHVQVIFYFAIISLAVVGTQVLNERWGEHVGHLGNVYLFYSTTLIVGVSAIGFISYEVLFTNRGRKIQVAINSLVIILLVASTSTNWTVLKRDGRTPGTELIAYAYEKSSLEHERCEAEVKFRRIGYPEGYSSIVIGAVKSFGARNLGMNFCEESEIRE